MELCIVPPSEFADRAATLWLQSVEAARAVSLGVPTGRTVVPVYARLAQLRARLPAGTRAFAIDEYCWPERGHRGTNAAFYAAHWPFGTATPVQTPDAASADPASAIDAHCTAIAEAGDLDLVLLGIGRNGHIAFNEPGSDAGSGCRVVALSEETRAQIAAGWQTPPTHGMTVGVRELLAARQIIVLASGAEKRTAVACAFGGAPATNAVPASLLRDHPRLIVLCDEAAGASLR